jgi:hypothetical protein
VKAESGTARSEIRELVDIFRGRIVDVGCNVLMIEISGREQKIEAFIERMRPYGIVELVRTGRIAMVRADENSFEERENEPNLSPRADGGQLATAHDSVNPRDTL